jgi:site-specific DNA-methyltransferase (adenine-specific)
MTPYYEHAGVTIYHGDCREILPSICADVLVTDPPYPNNAGHFIGAINAARQVVSAWNKDALVFWSELEHPPVLLPLVAVHIWHRSNVNGRPYEPIYQFALDGRKRRSDVFSQAAIFDGAGVGCCDYLGHPTQKPVGLMGRLLAKTTGLVCDPFMGVGATLVAAVNANRSAIGIEIEERYCEIAAKRLAQEVLPLEPVVPEPTIGYML